MARAGGVVLGSLVAAWLFAMVAEVGLYFWRAPQPLPLPSTPRANGEFYIVRARAAAPSGLRGFWQPHRFNIRYD